MVSIAFFMFSLSLNKYLFILKISSLFLAAYFPPSKGVSQTIPGDFLSVEDCLKLLLISSYLISSLPFHIAFQICTKSTFTPYYYISLGKYSSLDWNFILHPIYDAKTEITLDMTHNKKLCGTTSLQKYIHSPYSLNFIG